MLKPHERIYALAVCRRLKTLHHNLLTKDKVKQSIFEFK